MKNPARFRFYPGFAPIIIIVIVAAIVVGLIIIGVASNAIKSSFKITKDQPQATQNESLSKPSSSPSPKNLALSKTYTNNSLKLQINYPENWTVEEKQNGANIYAPGTDVNKATKSDAALIVTSSPLGSMKGLQLATIADVIKSQMDNFLPGATIVSSSATQVGGREAHLFDLITTTKDKIILVNSTF